MVDVRSRFQRQICWKIRYSDLKIFCFLTRPIIAWLLQGLDSHLKAINTHAFCFDSRCLPSQGYPMEWYVRHHLVAGFANSNVRKFCNAKFETFADEVFLVATKPIEKDEEIFVYYKVARRRFATSRKWCDFWTRWPDKLWKRSDYSDTKFRCNPWTSKTVQRCCLNLSIMNDFDFLNENPNFWSWFIKDHS